MKIKDLLDKRNKLVHDMRALLDANHDGLDAEKEAQYSAMESDLEKFNKQIDRENSLAAIQAKLDEPMDEPLAQSNSKQSAPTDMAAYKEAFFDFVRYGLHGMDGEKKALLAKFRAGLEEGTAEKGGYLVPTVIANEIITGLNAASWVRKLANVYSTASTTDIPVDASVPQFVWMGEKASYQETDLTLGKVTIGAYKMGGIIRVSEELLEDSAFNLEAHLQKKIAWGIDAAEEPAFLVGDGNGKPTGIVTSAAAGVTAASATAVTSDEVMDFVYSVSPRYRDGAVIVASSAFIKAVRKLKDGNGQYIWEPSYKAGEPDMLLGKPLRESEYLPGLESSATPAVIANWRYYDIADRGGIYLQRLVEKYADTGEVGFRVRKRTDGKLTLADAAKKFVMGA